MNFFRNLCSVRKKTVDNDSQYHIVNIQNLVNKNPHHIPSETLKKEHIQKLLGSGLLGRKETYDSQHLYYENSTCENNIECPVGFIGAFYTAYQNHKDVILSPDDVWNMIMIMFSKHVNQNSEALRSQFVAHEGQKKLTIMDYTNSVERSLEMEREWESGFFTQIMEQIKANTNEAVADALKADFSTTTPFEEIFSIATVMDSFQQYFSYGRMIMCCGINNVHFMGTLTDWQKLHDKTASLFKNALTEGDSWSTYVKHVLVILQQFIRTYQGKVDVDWWNLIFTTEEQRIGSGDDINVYLTGWFLHLLGIYHKVEMQDIPTHTISVPIQLENKLTNTKKDLTLLGGFTGVHHNGSGAYRPQLSMVMYHFQTKKQD